MIKQYIKLAFQLLKQNKLLSIISLLGTAFAICLIMCIFLVYEARTANYRPEVNRNRTLSVKSVLARGIEDEGWNTGGYLSLRSLKECFYSLTTPELVTAVTFCHTKLASSPGEVNESKCLARYADADFWKVFEFRFLSGLPYSQADFESGINKAVICSSLAKKVFGTNEVVGRTLSVSYNDYTICGVVADVSSLAEATYGEVWLPYTVLPDYESSFGDGLLYRYECYILAHSPADFEEIQKEAHKRVEIMNANQSRMKLVLSGAPDTPLMAFARENNWYEPNVTMMIINYVIAILIILLVPAINMSGIALSKMRQRMEEIGIRRTFGATRNILLVQILTENFILTLIGGFVGLILSYAVVLGMRSWFFGGTEMSSMGMDIMIQSDMIIRPEVFLCAFFFCLLMNLLSAGIPAYRLSRANIIYAINS